MSLVVRRPHVPFPGTPPTGVDNFTTQWRTEQKKGLFRALPFIIAFNIFDLSLAIGDLKVIAIGGALSLTLISLYRHKWVEHKKDFSSLSLFGKISSISLPILLGFLMPVTINSFLQTVPPSGHVKFAMLALAINIVIVPLIKKFFPDLEELIFAPDFRIFDP